MKIEWSENDIELGLVVGRPDREERFIIGFCSHINSKARYTLISMSDGMVQPPTTKKKLAQQLTEQNELPAALIAVGAVKEDVG